ncbi:bifunctional 3,4-dihydroxy-2-butanone-4-phosphate synthase/GTP cyclohydrolase II [Rhodococcus sp. NPDC057014]|uniref:bifunctional 3,4-dihydroxy-2-butanone-4-phosphate synthase/GTP cyclohydrolase II n=1 Tax=Rhodococcus sp. NPDC057014 TaxID=3346000 RepID=UPI00363D1882
MGDLLESHPTDAVTAVENAVASIRAGRMIVVVDDEDRENEGDLVMAAQAVTPEAVNFMAQHARGLTCVSLPAERLDELDLPPMVSNNTSSFETGFAVSVDVAGEGRTGISAADRAATIQALCDPNTRPADLVRPGHMFPLRAKPHGVLQRSGHTEAAADLARLAGFQPYGVLCEIMSQDGSMARRGELEDFSRKHGLDLVTVDDIVKYRQATEPLIECVAETRMPTLYGEFRAYGFKPIWEDRTSYLALVMGEVAGCDAIQVRLHSECVTGDVFASSRCDCGRQLHAAMERIATDGRGIVLYAIGHEGRGIGLLEKIRAYALQDDGLDTVDANVALGFPPDARDYGLAAQALTWLGAQNIRLLTNNPDKVAALKRHGINVRERIALTPRAADESVPYLRTKRDRLGHVLDSLETADRLLGMRPECTKAAAMRGAR